MFQTAMFLLSYVNSDHDYWLPQALHHSNGVLIRGGEPDLVAEGERYSAFFDLLIVLGALVIIEQDEAPSEPESPIELVLS